MDNLLTSSVKLKQEIHPEFFSVTFGASGSEQSKTFDAVTQINQTSGIPVAPHLTCIGSTRSQITEILENYKAQGINRIVALRGDIPDGASVGEFSYANELISFIRETTGDHFKIEVAAYPEVHPQAISAKTDLDNFMRKVNAGATTAITQYFYNTDAYFKFIDRCEAAGINIPVIPGIMPISNYTSLLRFSNMCGAEIPRWIQKQLESFGDDMAAIQDFGTDIVSELSQRLLDAGAPGLHFYSLNQSEPSLKIWRNLNI